MATSSSFNTSNTYIKYRIIVTENSYSVANNTSNVTVKVQAWRTNSGYETYGTGTCYCTIDGTTYSQSISSSQKISYNSYTQLFSKSLTINHNSDGSKALYVSSYISHSRFNSTSQGFTVNLTNIPRSATITNAPNFNDTQNPTITYSNTAGSSVSSLQACISLTGSNDDISYRNIPINGTSYTFNLTEVERNVLRQATTTSNSRTVYFYIKTIINGSTFYTSKAVTLSIVNANPTFNVAYLDTNSTTTAITNNNQQIIQNNSTLRINITNATALKYATLTSASININGAVTTQSLSGSSLTFNVGTINVAQNLTVPVTVTDSRNNKTTINLTIQVLDWSLPTAIISLARESNFYTTTNLTVNANYSSLNSKNAITIQYQIKKTTDANYGALTTISDNVQTQFNADNQYSWNVKVIVTDKIGSTTYNLLLYKGIPLMFWDRLLSSIGINCFPSKQYSLEINGVQIYGTDKTGELEDLETTDKTTLVSAINEARTTGGGGSPTDIVNLIYPVGSIYMSVNNTSPATLFGVGTWTQLKNAFLFATNATSGTKGTGSGTGTSTGAATGDTGSTTLTAAQSGLPRHQHALQNNNSGGGTVSWTNYGVTAQSNKGYAGNVKTDYAGGSNASEGHTHTLNSHTHTIPYLEIYVWKRIA